MRRMTISMRCGPLVARPTDVHLTVNGFGGNTRIAAESPTRLAHRNRAKFFWVYPRKPVPAHVGSPVDHEYALSEPLRRIRDKSVDLQRLIFRVDLQTSMILAARDQLIVAG